MPWKVRSVVKERMEFLEGWLSGEKSRSELCREFGISRKTGYKIAGRFLEEGEGGLLDRSHRPRSCPHAMGAAVRERILEERGRHPTWGPRKLLIVLGQQGVQGLPSRSSVARLLKAEGVVAKRPKRRRASPSAQLVQAGAPNEVWCMDFKGWFAVGTGERCDPLTLIDAHSRFLLACHGFFGKTGFEAVKGVLEEVFKQYGLPRYILTDNGTPFASCGIGGLTQLSVWLIKLGIIPLRIVPGKPQQNGRLERFHSTLKKETAHPPAPTQSLQRERFERFVAEYNEVRPHQALGDATPASVYVPSRRPYDQAKTTATLDYPQGVVVRRVQRNGTICWQNKTLFLSSALAGEAVGLRLHEDQTLATVLLGDYPVGLLNLATGRIGPMPAQVQLLAIHTNAGDSVHVGAMPTSVEPSWRNKAGACTASGLRPEPRDLSRSRSDGEQIAEGSHPRQEPSDLPTPARALGSHPCVALSSRPAGYPRATNHCTTQQEIALVQAKRNVLPIT